MDGESAKRALANLALVYPQMDKQHRRALVQQMFIIWDRMPWSALSCIASSPIRHVKESVIFAPGSQETLLAAQRGARRPIPYGPSRQLGADAAAVARLARFMPLQTQL